MQTDRKARWRSSANEFRHSYAEHWRVGSARNRLSLEVLEDRRLLAFTAERIASISSSLSVEHFIEVIDGVAYFDASQGSGPELWRSDGSAAGTWLVKDITPGPQGSQFDQIASIDGRLLFTIQQDDAAIAGLWTSDGTEAGTVRLHASVYEGNPSRLIHPKRLAKADDQVFFSQGDQLWKSDGTLTGTQLVHEFAFNHTGRYAVVGGNLFYMREGELWRSDGTTAGTQGLASGLGDIYSFGTFEDTLFFMARSDEDGNRIALWKSDGTTAGTMRVKTLPIELTDWVERVGAMHEYNGQLLMSVGNGLWSSDGTEAGTIELVSYVSRYVATDFQEFDGEVYFQVARESGLIREPLPPYDLWKTDGTVSGTRFIRQFGMGILEERFYEVDDTLFLTGDELLWSSDGTAAGTVPVADFPSGSYPIALADKAVLDSSLLIGTVEGLWVVQGEQPLQPEITVEWMGKDIANGHSTPSAEDGTDFGRMKQRDVGYARWFTVRNDGTSVLDISNLQIPEGFEWYAEQLDHLEPGMSANLTISIYPWFVGEWGGQVTFSTNDPDENVFSFSIAAEVIPGPIVLYSLVLTDLDGHELLTDEFGRYLIVPGAQFRAHVYTDDARGMGAAGGVHAAYVTLHSSGEASELRTEALSQSEDFPITDGIPLLLPTEVRNAGGVRSSVEPVGDDPKQHLLSVTYSVGAEVSVGNDFTLWLQPPQDTALRTLVYPDLAPALADYLWANIHVGPPPWRNASEPADIDGNGRVNANDLLLVINSLLEHGSRALPLPTVVASGAPYLDPSGDGRCSANDVIMVVNFLLDNQPLTTAAPRRAIPEVSLASDLPLDRPATDLNAIAVARSRSNSAASELLLPEVGSHQRSWEARIVGAKFVEAPAVLISQEAFEELASLAGPGFDGESVDRAIVDWQAD